MEVQNQTPLPMYKPSTYLLIRCHGQGRIMEILTQLLETDVEDHGLVMEILAQLWYYQLLVDRENGSWECRGKILRGC